MITAQELRIGNYLYGKDNMALQVSGIIDKYCVTVERNGKPVQSQFVVFVEEDSDCLPCLVPVPLTPEIFEKAGFTRNYNDFFNSSYYILEVFYPGPYKWGIYPVDIIGGAPIRGNKPLTYLHELQNLHFAITGTELNINL